MRRAAAPPFARGLRHDVVRLLTNLPFILGSLGIAAIGFVALFGSQIAPSDPQAQHVVLFYGEGKFAAPPTPPDEHNLLGTDPLGRDQLSRLLWGARLTLTAVLVGLVGRGLIGITLGVIGGWSPGSWIDRLIGYVTNAVGGLPQLMLALLVVIALQEHGATGFLVALALVGWPELSQFVRAEVMRIAAATHVGAARALGATGSRIVRTHVLRDLSPQLLGLLALEAGSVLLLLAELGFIGFFISGGTFYLGADNTPILPVRDRAPEWGSMLAGARHYTFRDQYVAFIPGVVVIAAVLAFNLFAEGLRAAADPFGAHRVSPRVLGGVARTFAAGALISAVAFGYVAASSGSLSFDEGLRRAEEAAERVLPGSELIAGVVRFESGEHALAQPAKLNYYFRDERGRTARVGFIDADGNAMEVKLADDEDDLPLEAYAPMAAGSWRATWEQALTAAEDLGGQRFRDNARDYVVTVILARDADAAEPRYRVRYAHPLGGGGIEVRVNAVTGSEQVPLDLITEDARTRARAALAGPVALISIQLTWTSEREDLPEAAGTERPSGYRHRFIRSDATVNIPSADVSHVGGREGAATTDRFGQYSGARPGGRFAVPVEIGMAVPDLVEAFERVEEAGGRELREGWEAEGGGWRVFVSAEHEREFDETSGGELIVRARYIKEAEGSSANVFFLYDPITGAVTECPRFAC